MKRKFKIGKSYDILIIDIETTGFLGQGGVIVEIGIVSLNIHSGETITVFDRVCKDPAFSEKHTKDPYGWIFDNSDLTFEMVMEADCISTLLPSVQKIIKRHPNGCTAFNRSFDVKFLESKGIVFDKLLPCPMYKSTHLVKAKDKRGKTKSPNVEEAWKHFFPDVPYIEKHRGADDAVHEAKIVHELIKQRKYFEDKNA